MSTTMSILTIFTRPTTREYSELSHLFLPKKKEREREGERERERAMDEMAWALEDFKIEREDF